MYRSASIRKYQIFAYPEWPGGLFASPSMAGTRPGVCMGEDFKHDSYNYYKCQRLCSSIECALQLNHIAVQVAT